MSHPKLTIHPTFVSLRELPTEGREFTYTHESGELTETLKDLIGKKSYKVRIELKPMGNVFSATGHIQTGMSLLCSYCALEFDFAIDQDFNEILVVREQLDRSSHSARVNHSSELNLDGPNCIELESDRFNIPEFIHELIAVAEPMKPTGKANCDQSCENYQNAVAKGWLTPENEAAFAKTSAFEALKGLKLNS